MLLATATSTSANSYGGVVYAYSSTATFDNSLFELNEAFASQATYCAEKRGLDHERVNVNGGAIALGHPLGATGTRLLLTLVREMEETGKALGCASACIGGGQGIAMILERA